MKVQYFGNIADLNDRADLILVSDSQDVQAIKEYLGNQVNQFDSFFVKVQDGEYKQIFAFLGNIPYLYKSVFEVVQ
ncbi:MAG: hypothetical protein D4S01_09065 [Dehalococcoidia bacterium]|nr:MAG: hypothetical protein D4S01_09065 [Dehalococcoidia bacterium]